MIHSFRQNGYNIVLDVASGSVHVVDDAAYDVINAYESKSEDSIVKAVCEKHGITPEEARECIANVKELKADGKLFSEDTRSEERRVGKECRL